MTQTEGVSLDAARDKALRVRAFYEILEQRTNGKVWSLQELMLGFSNDVGYIGRLILAHEGTWEIDGDSEEELDHKLAESLWWIFVLADRLEVDISAAFNQTMDRIGAELLKEVNRTNE